MTPQESNYALLELRLQTLERRMRQTRNDVFQFLGWALILFPLLMRQLIGEQSLDTRLALSVALAGVLTGVTSWARRRRIHRDEAQQKASILLSIRP